MDAVRSPGFAKSYGFGLLYASPPEIRGRDLPARITPERAEIFFDKPESVIGVGFPEHSIETSTGRVPTVVNVVRWAEPINKAAFSDALEQTWDWPEAESVLNMCQQKLLVADMTGFGLHYRDRYRLITAVTSAVVELTNPIAIHWEQAGCLVSPARLARRLVWGCNVRAIRIVRRKESNLMDTLGLAALGLRDVQCLYRGIDDGEVAKWMYRAATRMFRDGEVIVDGQRIPGPIHGESWDSKYEYSLTSPQRPVIDVKPSARHAGQR